MFIDNYYNCTYSLDLSYVLYGTDISQFIAQVSRKLALKGHGIVFHQYQLHTSFYVILWRELYANWVRCFNRHLITGMSQEGPMSMDVRLRDNGNRIANSKRKYEIITATTWSTRRRVLMIFSLYEYKGEIFESLGVVNFLLKLLSRVQPALCESRTMNISTYLWVQ